METKTTIKVKISPLMDEVRVVEVEPGTTIRDAINRAEVNLQKATDILLNDEPCSLDTLLNEPDSVVTLLPRVEAGR